jgi:hypothetical protein
MKTMSIMVVTILVFVAANASAQQKIARKELYNANIGTQTISTVDVREIVFQPKQMTDSIGIPAPWSVMSEGTIRFQIREEKIQIIRAGQICYEPAGAIIEHFDNASDRAPAKFIPYYLLNGQKELIEMFPATLD